MSGFSRDCNHCQGTGSCDKSAYTDTTPLRYTCRRCLVFNHWKPDATVYPAEVDLICSICRGQGIVWIGPGLDSGD